MTTIVDPIPTPADDPKPTDLKGSKYVILFATYESIKVSQLKNQIFLFFLQPNHRLLLQVWLCYFVL